MDTSKDTLLFLHGWGGDENSFAPLLPYFRIKYNCLAPTFSPPHPWTLEDYADFVEKFLDQHSIEHCHIIAHSFGARITALLVTRNPLRYGKLVLAGAAGLRMPSLRTKLRLKLRKPSKDYLAMPPEGKQTFKNIVNRDLSPEIANIQNKTLLIFGRNDKSTPVKMGRRWEKLMSDSKLVIYKNSGHFPYIDQTGRFIRDVALFLEG